MNFFNYYCSMAYTYRKPKDVKHLFELLGKTKTNWDLAIPGNITESQKYFDMYAPIVLIYENQTKLIGAAHGKMPGGPRVIDPSDVDITNTFTKARLNEIDVMIKQLEIF